MPLLRLFSLIVLFLAGPFAARAQEEESDYLREFNYGLNFNTYAGLIGGGSLKYAIQKPNGWYDRFFLEVVNIKHHKEARERGNISSWITYKTNYLFAVRPSYGKERVLFRKSNEEGVQLNANLGVGPSLGILKPYYVLVSNDPRDPTQAVSMPFDPDDQSQIGKIEGVGRVTDGFDKLRFIPGAHVRGGLSFEFGRLSHSVVGIEVGFVSEVYSQRIELMSVGTNKAGTNGDQDFKAPQVFNSLYLTLYYGNKH